MSVRDEFAARVEALEYALGLPGRVPLLRCGDCGYEVVELSRLRRRRACPRCGCYALAHVETIGWPPS
jgi:predicted Zn-ribbon and HTH transcriptional regulator